MTNTEVISYLNKSTDWKFMYRFEDQSGCWNEVYKHNRDEYAIGVALNNEEVSDYNLRHISLIDKKFTIVK